MKVKAMATVLDNTNRMVDTTNNILTPDEVAFYKMMMSMDDQCDSSQHEMRFMHDWAVQLHFNNAWVLVDADEVDGGCYLTIDVYNSYNNYKHNKNDKACYLIIPDDLFYISEYKEYAYKLPFGDHVLLIFISVDFNDKERELGGFKFHDIVKDIWYLYTNDGLYDNLSDSLWDLYYIDGDDPVSCQYEVGAVFGNLHRISNGYKITDEDLMSSACDLGLDDHVYKEWDDDAGCYKWVVDGIELTSADVVNKKYKLVH